MSLFPAYSDTNTKVPEDPISNNSEWLENSSFQPTLITPQQPDVTEAKNTATNSTRKHKKRKKTKEKLKNTTKQVIKSQLTPEIVEDVYRIELSGARELLNVTRISRPSAPKCEIKYWIRDKRYPKTTSKTSFKRYHKYLHVPSKPDKEQPLTSKNLDTIGFAERDEHYSGFKEEKELSDKTGYYNKHLNEHPDDIKVWLEYIRFQDIVHDFEKTHKKGSIVKTQKVLAERKLSILEKALLLNINDESLQRERLKITARSYPSDELQMYLKNLVEKDKGNIILWQGYIEATQCSMSHCNTPNVLQLYTKCLSTLHQMRRASSVERHLLEESILNMLYQCGLFLKQAGLFEQLWTLLKLYLELNLSPNDKSKFDFSESSRFEETQLVELEEVILTSNLPLHELWLRIEKLRESCHFLPHNDVGRCEDPQRMVFVEDVAELVHPITMPNNVFKLTATVYSLLKVPLLPCRHTTMKELGLDYVPWNLDSIEPLLAVFLPLYPIEISKSFWSDTKLAVGPQYLKKIPGHEEYLRFVLKLMENCAGCLNGDDKMAATIWFFRFQRLLVILHNSKLFIMSDSLKKLIRKTFKDVLKVEENRQNEIYYLEYALLEYELGNIETCSSIIETALKFNKTTECDFNNIDESLVNWCHLHKQYVQLEIKQSRNESAVKLLCKMVSFEHRSSLEEIEEKFHSITHRLLENFTTITCVQHFLPNFFTDWIICNGWFLYLTKTPEDCFRFLSNCLETLRHSDTLQKEVLYEFYAAVLFKYSTESREVVKLLDEVLYSAVECYPNNIFLLSVLGKRQELTNCLGLRWWKVQNLLLSTDRALASLYAVIIVKQQIDMFQEDVIDTITESSCGLRPNLKNQMLSVLKKITSGTNTRKCGLIWRLYLQFVYAHFSPEICRNVYYSAVEECPWLKALYMDAAIYIPTELAQIQDLIIEKQLRLHVTPEELDVLRN
ncbi:unnamed protein product [Phyllotreta striolata]|uniref:Protein NRDE2 homolog n=1 Tax=Phyllotreta striolata TaxID=444603 RepID=A0A9N9TPI8_PHYSR|nr:unnamed protein product [Phyllotreta striolata]